MLRGQTALATMTSNDPLPRKLGGELVLLHVDAAVVVVDKPPGLLAVPGRREADCVWARVVRELPDALVVHRLDQATSGLMLLARGAAMQRQLSIAFATRQVNKVYEAVVHGLPAADEGLIDAPLAADWPNRPRQRVDAAGGRPSQTRWRVIARDPLEGLARLQLEPLTGRSHQLRVHLASIGHPIVGDALYGPSGSSAEPRMRLHATQLGLEHPSHGAPLAFSSKTPF